MSGTHTSSTITAIDDSVIVTIGDFAHLTVTAGRADFVAYLACLTPGVCGTYTSSAASAHDDATVAASSHLALPAGYLRIRGFIMVATHAGVLRKIIFTPALSPATIIFADLADSTKSMSFTHFYATARAKANASPATSRPLAQPEAVAMCDAGVVAKAAKPAAHMRCANTLPTLSS